ncbi:winged helix-turn-helix domain-containing protein [Phytoactinopolyspora mesophila]|uniref:GntR family transcriptional regulator n=1 Tax=Phytoactinopolyspora mesophila TaxID=2650750 RepID=A0A7K3M2H8_9ACTN|nr:winged helix-turn-helix domain-containing protein [Phytoactinopolyspora mesophila]NDL56638.1 GntR family transcriptional regulator [Phytoactinopolyspora mesophila]
MVIPKFDPHADEPGYLYMKLADHVASYIETGDLVPGSRLPGEEEFAAQHDVSVGTVRRATDELRERGLVVTLPAKGTYIVNPDRKPSATREPTSREP